MGPGWVKFYRKAWNEHPDITMTGAWVWLICAAEYEGKYRGMLATTITSLAEHWCVSWKKAKNILRSWIEDKMIWVEPINESEIDIFACTAPSVFAEGHVEAKVHKGVMITILNYERYQGGDVEEDEAKVEASGNLCLEKNKKEEELSLPSGEMGKNINQREQPSRPTSKHREVIDHYHETFRRRFGRKYIWQARDFGILKRLMKSLDADDLMHRISEYLSDEEPFLLKNGHTVALFQNRVNAYGKPNFGEKHTEGSGFLKSVY